MTDETAPCPSVDDPAVAFEELRRAVSLTRVAIEGLTAARERVPDYSETLSEMLAALRVTSQRLALIEARPAISLSPATLSAEIVRAAEPARAADHKQLRETRDDILRAIGRIDMIVDHGRAAHHQRRFAISIGIGATIATILVMAILPGAIARSLPASWHVPEWMAARITGYNRHEADEAGEAQGRPSPTACSGGARGSERCHLPMAGVMTRAVGQTDMQPAPTAGPRGVSLFDPYTAEGAASDSAGAYSMSNVSQAG
jgi:hypothetical protein